ncbi:MAG: sporulation protein YjcZ [Bacilli bacterium]|nr:sporulation protein YjcZ [Bacilli bacterium]
MYYYGGYQGGYGTCGCYPSSCGGYGNSGFGSGTAIVLVLFILLVIVLSSKSIVQ